MPNFAAATETIKDHSPPVVFLVIVGVAVAVSVAAVVLNRRRSR